MNEETFFKVTSAVGCIVSITILLAFFYTHKEITERQYALELALFGEISPNEVSLLALSASELDLADRVRELENKTSIMVEIKNSLSYSGWTLSGGIGDLYKSIELKDAVEMLADHIGVEFVFVPPKTTGGRLEITEKEKNDDPDDCITLVLD